MRSVAGKLMRKIRVGTVYPATIGLGFLWSKDDPTATRDDIIHIARSLVRAGG